MVVIIACARYLVATFLQITNEIYTYLAREGVFRDFEVQRITFEVVVLCAILCYIVPRYFGSLKYKSNHVLSFYAKRL